MSPSPEPKSTSYDAGSAPKDSSRKGDKKIAGPKALTTTNSDQEAVQAADGEQGLISTDYSVLY